MVILVYLLIVIASVAQSAAAKQFHRTDPHAEVFNATKAGTALLLFFLVAIFGFRFHLPTLLFGLSYGASLCLSMYAGYKALARGPMALTSMLVAFSVVIPLLWGITVEQEQLTVYQIPAFVFLLAAIVLTNVDSLGKRNAAPSSQGKPPHRGGWLWYVGITFVANGICSVLQKRHQSLYPEAYSREFMFFAMLLCTLVFGAIALRRTPLRDWSKIQGKRYGMLSGAANGAANFLTLVLAGLENASVLFPILSAGTILASLLCGRLFFREKTRPNHYAALVAGIAAVVLLKL